MLNPQKAWIAQLNPFAHFLALIREPLLGRAPTLLNYSVAIGICLTMGILGLRLLGKHRWKVPYWIA
jgi:ABC-2 type transport system permease protein/lipopolysaccharide transport system permease protein